MSEMEDKKVILAVDDSGIQLRKLKSWLQDRYEVLLANSASMALKCLEKNIPDLILLDYEMPECNGEELFKMIRQNDKYNDIKVVFLTSIDSKEQIMKVLALSPEGYLVKPVLYNRLMEEIDSKLLD